MRCLNTELSKRKGYRRQTTGHSVLRKLCLHRGDALRLHRLKGEINNYICDVMETCVSLEASRPERVGLECKPEIAYAETALPVMVAWNILILCSLLRLYSNKIAAMQSALSRCAAPSSSSHELASFAVVCSGSCLNSKPFPSSSLLHPLGGRAHLT